VVAVTDVPQQHLLPLREWAAIFALALAMAAGAWLLYQLLDVVLLVFLGVTLAAALQPWHTRLCGLGVPRGVAVLLIYLLFALVLAGLAVLALPALVDELGQLLATVPEKYGALLGWLRDSDSRMLRLFGQRLPPFESLPSTVTVVTAESVRGIFGLTTGFLALLTWVVTVLAVAFYWTLDVPRLERLVLSMLPVARRTQALGAWREIESKLGAYLRAQGIAMVVVGVASGVGYVLIGLPNPLALAVLAGLFEGIPLLGPFLAAVPALLAALALGLPVVLLTLGWSTLVQLLESNVLVPRIMSHAVGVSALVSLVAILAFGSTYGVLGVFIAVPLAAVIQVVLDHFVLDAASESSASDPEALAGLRSRALTLRQRVRLRFRGRTVRMGIDPETPEHVVDAVDQQMEEAVERIATMIRAAQRAGGTTDAEDRSRMLATLQAALRRIERAVARVDAVEDAGADRETEQLPLDELASATAQAEKAAEGAEAAIGPIEETPPATVRRLDHA
jgi:predicted PurR-regulated permease PerM